MPIVTGYPHLGVFLGYEFVTIMNMAVLQGLMSGANGPMGLMVFFTWLVVLVIGVLLIMWLWQKISR